jgi:hypothetical protein
MAPLVGPTWPILITEESAAAAAGAEAGAEAAGAAASSFFPQADSIRTTMEAAAESAKVDLFI